MRRSSSFALAGTSLAALVAVALLASTPAAAYEKYSNDSENGRCATCHGNFRTAPYETLADGELWPGSLHDVHRDTMLNFDCDVCHMSSLFPVEIGSSLGGTGLSPFGCSGCHGRAEDGVAEGFTVGYSAGLRQHHWVSGVTGCVTCHVDSNPANYTPAGEDVLPPYYSAADPAHPNMPSDPCNPPPGFPENYGGPTQGLDNDGDRDYDRRDTDCGAGACGNGTLDPGEDCDDGNTADGDCCSATCGFEAAASPCDDGLFCTTAESCDGAGSCGGGSPIDCNDGELCTDDVCDESADACDNRFDPSNDPTCIASCPDQDADGFSGVGGACGAIDCDDGAATVFPGATEVCDDDLDNDCDGAIDAADDACGYDGEWAVRPGPLDDPAYAGSPACAECHAGHFDHWEDSLHARVQIRPGDAQATGFPLPPSDPSRGLDVGSWRDVSFVIGQKWKTRYVDKQGFVQGIQWNYLLGEWAEVNGGESEPYSCGPCHTTGFDAEAAFVDAQGQPVPGIEGSWVEFNVGCEACHGPGAAHVAQPSAGNINQIEFDWYDPDQDGTPDPVDLRSSIVCANCHYRNDRERIQIDRNNAEQYNDWLASGHADSLQPSGINTYCAKCHSPGNAEFYAAEHNFNYFEPSRATHVTCIGCHEPHGVSAPRWATLAFPTGGQQDPRDEQATLARYRGSDGNPATGDFDAVEAGDSNQLCGDCHRQVPGFRRHRDARPSEVVVLEPRYNSNEPFVVPHREHVEEGYAECVDCHMHYSRTSINEGDVRSHSFLPNEWAVDETKNLPHYDETCGQCHDEAPQCTWCHTEFGDNDRKPPKAQPRKRKPGRS